MTTYTTEQMVKAIEDQGVMGDAKQAVQTYDMGGLKFIVRACLKLSIADSDWLKFGTLYNLSQAIQSR